MTENDILNINNSKNISELLGKMKKFYPTGFDIKKIEPRIRAKIEELEEYHRKYNGLILDEPRQQK